MSNDPQDVAIFNVETDGKGMYFVATNERGFKILQEFLDLYGSDANEQDQSNPHVQ